MRNKILVLALTGLALLQAVSLEALTPLSTLTPESFVLSEKLIPNEGRSHNGVIANQSGFFSQPTCRFFRRQTLRPFGRCFSESSSDGPRGIRVDRRWSAPGRRVFP